MRPRRRLPLLLAPILVLGACASTADHSATDRAASILVTAISYPRQEDAAGWARAAQETPGGRSGEIVVLRADDLREGGTRGDDLLTPSARLLFRIHFDPMQDAWGHHPAVNACYRATFNRYGVIGSPARVECPAHARPLALPAAPPAAVIPAGSDRVLRSALRRVGTSPDVEDLRRSLTTRLRPATGAPGPAIDVQVRGTRIGVALRTPDACLLGRRLGRSVRVYAPPRLSVEPGEMPCDATTALGPRLRPPH